MRLLTRSTIARSWSNSPFSGNFWSSIWAGKPYAEVVIDVWDHVHAVAPFAFRTLDELGKYTDAAADLGVGWEPALDEQLLQKVLPKFKGAETRVQDSLSWLVEMTDGAFPLTHAKAQAMLAHSEEHGFTDYFA